MIIIELLYNLSLLVAISVLSGFIDNRWRRTTITGKVLQGILFGMAAVLGMINSFVLSDGIIFDGRSVVLSICGLFFGPVPAVIAGLITIVYRLIIGGPGWIMGVSVITSSVIIGIIFYNRRIKQHKYVKTSTLVYMGVIVHVVMLVLMLGLPSGQSLNAFRTIALSVIIFYPIATVVIGKILMEQENNKILLKNLIESETTFKMYIESAPDAILVVDGKGNYIDINPAAEKITGYSKNEFLKKNVTEFTPKEEQLTAIEHFKNVKSQGSAYGESRFIRKDGSIGWWTVDAVKISDNKYLGFSKDITVRKNAEFQKEESLKKFQAIFDLAPDAMKILRLSDSCYIDINSKFEELFGYSSEDILGKSSANLDFWINQSQREEYFQILNNNGRLNNLEIDFRSKNGKIVNTMVSASVISFNDDKYVIAIISDMTHKKKFENELKNSEKRYKDLIENLPDGFYQSTPEGKFVYLNPAFVKMLGYDSREELMAVDIPNTIYHALDDRVIVAEENFDYSNDFDIYRLKKKDGSSVWIEDHNKYIKDDSGNIILHEGICRDITERISSQKANAELIDRIKKVSQHLPGFIFQYCMKPDGSRSFPYASEGIIDIYGVTSAEVIADTSKLAFLIHPDDLDGFNKRLLKSAKNLENWRYEYRVCLPDAKTIWVEVNSTPEKQDDGSIIWHGYISDVTERKLVEESIRENEFSLRFAQEIAGMGSWEIDVTTSRLKWSENYFKLLGYTPFTFEPENSDFINRIHPDDITFVKKHFDEFFKNPKPGSFEFRIILPDGTIKWLLNSFLPIFVNGRLQTIKGINLDITDRKKSDVNLRKLSRAVDQSPLAIIITSLDAEIEYANPKFTEITGYALKEIIGANPRILQSNYHNSEYYKNIWDTLLQGDVWQGEILNRKKTGETYWESMVIAPVSDDKGVTTNYIAIKEDITEKIRLQNELINAKNRAEESDKLKSAFLANMSHEIRTPMNGIMGFSRMLGSGDLTDAEREEFAEILNSSCNRLINTVNDILDISKIEANQMDVRISNFSIISLFEELRTAYIDTNSKSEVQFITKLNNIPESFSMYSDEQKVFQILNNLVSNAFKFTNEGSIELGGRLLENKIEFYVSDTGIGISEDAMSMIFGRFYQADSSLSRGYEGTGLGLAICRGMIELLGGSISVESKLGTGSIFRIELPLNS